MSDQIAVHLSGVGKMYKIYPSRLDNFLDELGLAWLTPWRRIRPGEFWALRDINFELKKGSRLGIIGRNGAGKSTLLKLITGNLPATEGKVSVNGQVQALLEAGAGFHPEFTGYENIRAALTYQGFNSREIQAATQDIAEFTELGQFLAQPFKTYSAGMQARLVFATATTLRPDILIIDEILGAGDAYFASKSAERMKQLVEESGASVLLVSHSMPQILQYCDECIWIERGRIVKRGQSMEVVNAYEGFIHLLEDRRLKAKNRKRHSATYDPALMDGYGDALLLAFIFQGEPGAKCDITEVTLLKNGQVEETLKVGDVQDISSSYMAMLALNGSQWSEPNREQGNYFRRLAIQLDGPNTTVGYAVFYVYALFEEANYAFNIRYRCDNPSRLAFNVSRNGSLLLNQADLPSDKTGWTEWCVPLPKLTKQPEIVLAGNGKIDPSTLPESSPVPDNKRAVIRWPGEGSVTIEKILLLGPNGQEQTVFLAGESLTLSMTVLAQRSGHFNLVSGATLFRLDGVFASNLVSQAVPLDLEKGERRELRLEMDPLNLGDGYYVFSVSIFEQKVTTESRYDLIARGYEFQVVGNDPVLAGAIFQHQSKWSLV